MWRGCIARRNTNLELGREKNQVKQLMILILAGCFSSKGLPDVANEDWARGRQFIRFALKFKIIYIQIKFYEF